MVRDSPSIHPAVFAIMLSFASVAYAGQLPLTYYLLKTKPRRYVIIIGMCTILFALFTSVIGPDEEFNQLGKSIYLNITMIFYGYGFGTAQTLLLPEILE